MLGKYQSDISELPVIPKTRYENIFRLYSTGDAQYYYNLLQSIYIDGEIDPQKIFYMSVKESLPWSIISYNAYGTMDLWWLIAIVNKIYNPVDQPEVGSILKVIRPEYVESILTEINRAIQQ
jgi:hypothetical protein